MHKISYISILVVCAILVGYVPKDVVSNSGVKVESVRKNINSDTDYDEDGVLNDNDLDDDNDGILDIDEGFVCTTNSQKTVLKAISNNIPAEGTSYCGGLKNSYTHFSDGYLDTQNDITGTYTLNYSYSGLDVSKEAIFQHRLVYSNVNGSHGVDQNTSNVRITSKIYVNNTLVRTASVTGWNYHSQPREKIGRAHV